MQNVRLFIDIYRDVTKRIEDTEYYTSFEYSYFNGDMSEWNEKKFAEEFDILEEVSFTNHSNRFVIARSKRFGDESLFSAWNKSHKTVWLLVSGFSMA